MKTNIKNLLADSLFIILKYKKLEDITVKELVNKANISRASFYNNYNNIYDIINYKFNIIIKNINDIYLLNKLRKGNSKTLLYNLLIYIDKNKEDFRVIRNSFFFDFKKQLDLIFTKNNIINYYKISGSIINLILYYMDNNFELNEFMKKIDKI